MKTTIYGVTSSKGGVGKTTLCANLGGILADLNQRVLLVDADPQQSLSRYFKLAFRAPAAITQVYERAALTDAISQTVIPNLDIVLNDDPDSVRVTNFLRQSVTHFHHLHVALVDIDYDYVLIDTQGAKGITQESVIFAAHRLLSPVRPKVLEAREFVYGTVEMVRKFHPKPGFPSITGRPMPSLHAVINGWDRTRGAQEITRELRSTFHAETSQHIDVLQTVIPDLEVYPTATAARSPVHRFETHRRGATEAAQETMLKLVQELEPKLSGVDLVDGGIRS